MSSKLTVGRVMAIGAILCSIAAAQPVGGSGTSAGAAAMKPATHDDGSHIVLQQQPDFVLWDADKRIEPGTIGLVYRVEQVDGFRLLLNAPGHGLRGWTTSGAVISLKRAEAYFTQAIVTRPEDFFAYLMRGIARWERGDADGALADFDQALKRQPNDVPALVRRASLLRARLEFDRALADLDRAIASDGRDPSAHVERAVLAFTHKETAQAWKDLDCATELGSRDVIVPMLRAQILLQKKDTKRAYDAFVTALKADPSRHEAYLGLASVFLMRGQPKQAQALLDDAVRADPDNPEAYGNRATLYLTARDYEKALFNLSEVIRLSPGSARAYNERAWLLATCPDAKFRDGRAAVEAATRACELSGGKSPRYLATLAAAQAETGDFDAAAKSQELALSLIAASSPDRTEFRRALERYRAKKPHHSLGILEELGIRSYQPPARSPG
jgi:tetratricopeptide (TPR) repeat protein